jgi:hypothetical protein
VAESDLCRSPGGGRATRTDHEPRRSKKTTVLSLGLNVGEILEVEGEVGMRLAALLSLGLNRWHKDEGREGGGRCSRWVQVSRRIRNQEAEDAAVQSPR